MRCATDLWVGYTVGSVCAWIAAFSASPTLPVGLAAALYFVLLPIGIIIADRHDGDGRREEQNEDQERNTD